MSRLAHTIRVVSNHMTRRIAIHLAASLGMYPVVAFPRSGGTWLCKTLAIAADLPFAQVPVLPVAMPSIVHAHWRHHPGLRNCTTIVRDGRDVMVSFYFYCKLQYESGPSARLRRTIERLYGPRPDLADAKSRLPVFIDEMFKRPIGVRQDWASFCLSWAEKPGVATVRYENLIRDPVREIRMLLGRLDLPVRDDRVGTSVELNSMRRLTGRAPGDEDAASVVRKGVVGDWREYFSDESRSVFADRGGDALIALGYEENHDWCSRSGPTNQAGDGSTDSSSS